MTMPEQSKDAVSTVKRYEFYEGSGGFCPATERPDGDYVLYEDYAALASRLPSPQVEGATQTADRVERLQDVASEMFKCYKRLKNEEDYNFMELLDAYVVLCDYIGTIDPERAALRDDNKEAQNG